jgi:hypothetical protein
MAQTPLPLEEGISRRRVCQDDRNGRILSEYHRLHHPNFDEIPLPPQEFDPVGAKAIRQMPILAGMSVAL